MGYPQEAQVVEAEEMNDHHHFAYYAQTTRECRYWNPKSPLIERRGNLWKVLLKAKDSSNMQGRQNRELAEDAGGNSRCNSIKA